jgi:hypothetical protein
MIEEVTTCVIVACCIAIAGAPLAALSFLFF